jgi:hypothetical protein
MFAQLDGGGKLFEVLMLIVCLGLLGLTCWLDYLALSQGTLRLRRWDFIWYSSLIVAVGYFVRALLTDDVTGKWIFQRKKR